MVVEELYKFFKSKVSIIIVFITMRYSARKIKKENILEAIREENI